MVKPQASRKSSARTDVLRIRLTEAERAALDGIAAKNTLDTSTWARMELMKLAQQNADKKAKS
jgi:hypothetical protein